MALEEHDISAIRDQLASMVTGIESRIDARFSQILANVSSSNSGISNLREEVRRIEQRQGQITSGGGGGGGRRREAGLPVPAYQAGSGGSVPDAMNLAVRQASLLQDSSRDVARYAQDLATASNKLGGELLGARAFTSELRTLLQASRSGQRGATSRLGSLGAEPMFGEVINLLQSEVSDYRTKFAQGGSVPGGLEGFRRQVEASSLLDMFKHVEAAQYISGGGISDRGFLRHAQGVLGPSYSPEAMSAISGRLRESGQYIARARGENQRDETAERNARELIESFGGERGIERLRASFASRQIELQGQREEGTLTSSGEEEMSRLSAALNDVIPALQQLGVTLDGSTQKTSAAIGGLITSVVGALGIQQFMMMRFVQQPYQYQTLPALGLMGSTGMMGEALSGAYGAQESVLQSYREFGVNSTMGVGALAGGALGLRLGGGAIGAALGAGVGLVGAGVLGINFQDDIAKALAGENPQRAFTAELGRRMLDPQKFSQEFLLPTMQARVNLGITGEEGRTAAQRLGDMASSGAQALGYDAVVVGQLLGAALSSLRPGLAPSDDESSRRLIDTISELEAFGVSREMGMGLLSTLSAAGSEDYRESIARLALATSEDGEITNYTANVLVPALAKVVESRAIQNISKNSELVERETAGLFSFFKNSDTNLGKMLSANPEVMSRVFGMLDQVSETALQDPALMLYLNRMGVSFSEVLQGDPRTLTMPMQMFARQASYDASGKIDLNNMSSISALMGFLTMSGVGVSTGTMNIAAEMFSALQQASRVPGGGGVNLDDFTERLRMESPEYRLEQAFAQFSERMTQIVGSEGAAVTSNIVQETNTFFSLMSDNVTAILAIQTAMQTVLGDTGRMSTMIAQAGLDILNRLIQVTGVTDILNTEGYRNLQSMVRAEFESRGLTPLDAVTNVVLSEGNLSRDSFGVDQQNALRTLLVSTGREVSALGPDEFYVGAHDIQSMFDTDFLQGLLYDAEASKLAGEELTDSQRSALILSKFINAQNENSGLFIPEELMGNFATGGYTGIGSRLDVAGVVHGGEYVISDNNVSGNLATLERMQAGERFDENSPFSMTSNESGETIRVMLEFSNTNPEQIINAAKRSALSMLREERLI